LRAGGADGLLPTHACTPDGARLPIFSAVLAAEVEERCGEPVQMMQLRQGIFDDATISVIASNTVDEICRLAECQLDVRRFRPNILVRALRPVAFQEDTWLGGVLSFGGGENATAVAVTMRDIRCAMVNLDPDSARSSPEVLQAVVRANKNNAGVYGTVIRVGQIAVGQTITLNRAN
jgi:hypothetical protein